MSKVTCLMLKSVIVTDFFTNIEENERLNHDLIVLHPSHNLEEKVASEEKNV